MGRAGGRQPNHDLEALTRHSLIALAIGNGIVESFPVLTPEEALGRIRSTTSPRPARSVALAASLDEFAAEDVYASLSLPAFDNSSMDGYAVVASSCANGTRLTITGEQPAGANRRLHVRAGEAVRIFTGAPIPAGADAVVMQEDVEVSDREICLNSEVAEGDFIRRQGGDVAAGQKILAAGERIRPQTLALLAAQGAATARVGGEVKAAVISTGDEIKPPGAVLAAGEIYESNSALLIALLQRLRVRVEFVEHCPDNRAAIDTAIRKAANCDVMIFSGGVSVGARDLVKPALAGAGAQLDFWRVAVKPGKPFLFGKLGECAVFGLPGNPVSAFVTFVLFVRPALLRMRGANDQASALRAVPARSSEPAQNDGERPHYLRGMLDSGGAFRAVGTQESHALFGLSRSNALLLVQPAEKIAAGDIVSVLLCD